MYRATTCGLVNFTTLVEWNLNKQVTNTVTLVLWAPGITAINCWPIGDLFIEVPLY